MAVQTIGQFGYYGPALVIIGPVAIVAPIIVVENLVLALVLKRFGLFAFMVALFVMGIFAAFPMTFQASA